MYSRSYTLLDTHPNDQEAMKYYNEGMKRLLKMKETYLKNGGALTNRDGKNLKNYINEPFPWMKENLHVVVRKTLAIPVNVKKPDAKTAKIVMSQLGGPNGELGAALRYLSQRFTMPYPRVQALLTDIGTEELAHVEIISTLFYQLTNGLTHKEIKDGGLDAYFTDHTLGVYPTNSAGIPFSADIFQSVGDPISDLTEDMAAEQKARTTYDNILFFKQKRRG